MPDMRSVPRVAEVDEASRDARGSRSRRPKSRGRDRGHAQRQQKEPRDSDDADRHDDDIASDTATGAVGAGQGWDDVGGEDAGGAGGADAQATSWVARVATRVTGVPWLAPVVSFLSGHARASAACGTVVALVVCFLVFGAGGSDSTLLWVDDDDECVNYLADAEGGGTEEVEIPESVVADDGTTYRVGYVASWEGHVGPLRALGITGDVLKMADFYDARGGSTDAYGFEKVDDTYIVAIGQGPFRAKGSDALHVGDLLTISFDDGTTIKALVGDTKGRYGVADPYDEGTWNKVVTGTDPQGRPDTSCGWGHAHNGEVSVLEFWGSDGSGNPMSGALQASTGGSMTRVVGITDHGMASEFADFAGYANSVLGSALVSMRDVRSSTAASSVAECKTHGNYDNSTLVSALVSYSYSQSRTQSDSEPSTALYQEVCEAVLGVDDYCYSYHYHSCDRGVAAAVRWTGADVNFPAGACDGQFAYCYQSPLWEPVAENVTIGGGDDWARSQNLQPGDVGISNGNHTLAYVGHDAVTEGYEQFIRGNDGTTPGTGGDIGEPSANAAYVSASSHTRGANISEVVDGRIYTFFRYVGDYPDADKYADVGASATINGTNVAGTPCACSECDVEEESAGFDGIVEAAKAFLGQPYVWGGSHSKGPNGYDDPNPHGTDCSGLVLTAYYLGAGIDITGQGGGNATGDHGGDAFVSHIDAEHWKQVSASEAAAGDIMLVPGHVMIYEGDNMRIHADGTSTSESPYDPAQATTILRWVGPAADGSSSGRASSAKPSKNWADTMLIGDSIIAGTRSAFEGKLPGVHIDAIAGRGVDDNSFGYGAYGAIQRAGAYKNYVIEIGINDGGLTMEAGERLVASLPNRDIWFVNQYLITGAAGDVAANETCDATIQALAARHDNVRRIDWKSKAAGHESEWFADGICHLNEAGGEALAACVADALSDSGSGVRSLACKDTSNASRESSGAYSEDNVTWYAITSADVDAWAQKIEAAFLAAGHGSVPLAGHARDIANAAAATGIDPRLCATFSIIESGGGEVCAAPYNAWGWGGPGNFDHGWTSWKQSIDAWSEGYKSGYGTTFNREKAARYCDESYYDAWMDMFRKMWGND